MRVCPYNAKHVHPTAEHQYHLVHCPDRVIVDRDIIYGMKLIIASRRFVSALSMIHTDIKYSCESCVQIFMCKFFHLYIHPHANIPSSSSHTLFILLAV